MTCEGCGYENGLHQAWCTALAPAFDKLTQPKHAKLQEAILAAGYEPLIIVGFGTRADGEFSLKVGANPAIRGVSNETWQHIRETINRALDRLREAPMDDLDIVSGA